MRRNTKACTTLQLPLLRPCDTAMMIGASCARLGPFPLTICQCRIGLYTHLVWRPAHLQAKIAHIPSAAGCGGRGQTAWGQGSLRSAGNGGWTHALPQGLDRPDANRPAVDGAASSRLKAPSGARGNCFEGLDRRPWLLLGLGALAPSVIITFAALCLLAGLAATQ